MKLIPAIATTCIALLAVGCDLAGTRNNPFTATPVSRSTAGESLDPTHPSSLQAGHGDAYDPMRMGCQSELNRQQSYPFDFRLRTLANRTVQKRQFAGRLLVVDIWATWCGPCVREVPHFIDLQQRYQHAGLSMLGINYERGSSDLENRRSIDSFARSVGINYPLALGDASITNQIPDFRGYPTTVFIDGNGRVRLTLRGSRSAQELEMFVKLLLEDPSIDPNLSSQVRSESAAGPAKIQSNPFASGAR